MKFAGFWRRFAAHLVDSSLIGLLACFLVWASKAIQAEPDPLWIERPSGAATLQIKLVAAYVIIALAYYVIGHSRFGSTLGKRLFKIRVYELKGLANGHLRKISFARAVARYLALFLSLLPLGAGFAWVFFNPKKQALHEWLTATVSVLDR